MGARAQAGAVRDGGRAGGVGGRKLPAQWSGPPRPLGGLGEAGAEARPTGWGSEARLAPPHWLTASASTGDK